MTTTISKRKSCIFTESCPFIRTPVLLNKCLFKNCFKTYRQKLKKMVAGTRLCVLLSALTPVVMGFTRSAAMMSSMNTHSDLKSPRSKLEPLKAAGGSNTKPKKIIVFGGDGFCGWPTALHLSDKGHEVCVCLCVVLWCCKMVSWFRFDLVFRLFHHRCFICIYYHSGYHCWQFE